MKFNCDDIVTLNKGRLRKGKAIEVPLGAVRVTERRCVEADIALGHIVSRNLDAIKINDCTAVGHDFHGGPDDQLRRGDLEFLTEIDSEVAIRINLWTAQRVAVDAPESQWRVAGHPTGIVEGRVPPSGAHIDSVVEVAPVCGAFCEQGGFAE